MTVEEQAAVDAQALEAVNAAEEAAFNSGITDAPVAPTEVTPPVVSAVPAVVPEPVVEPVVVPAPYQVSEAQILDLVNKTRSIDDLSATLSKVHASVYGELPGKLGGLERTLKEIQANTPVGQPIEVSDKDLAELQEEFPELTVKLAKGLTRVLSRFKGTSQPAVVPQAINVEEILARANQAADVRVAQAQELTLRKVEVERVADKYPNWYEITGGPDDTTPYRTWLQAQPPAYRAKVLGSWKANEIVPSLDAFLAYDKEAKKNAAKPVVVKGQDARSQRLAQAIPARGHAPAPVQPGELTEEQAFAQAIAT